MTRDRRLLRPLAIVLAVALVLGALSGGGPALAQGEATPAYALAMHGDLKYPETFPNLDYVNPDAPKGGEITLHAIGTYNSFNPYILEGDAYYTSFGGSRYIFETLTEQTNDEAFSEYCLLCETIETPEDRSYVQFKLRDNILWSDGTPMTADDLIFSYNTIMEKGHPFYQDYWGSIETATKVDDLTVRFDFTQAEEQNRELPLIAGQMPVLQQAWWSTRDFAVPITEVPVSSGPYTIENVQTGVGFTFVRRDDYWGKDLPINVGRFNFDRINVDYYRDQTVALEAFKAGEYDFRYENSSKNWATGYDFPALSQGLVTKELIPNQSVNGMQGFLYNLRKPQFEDPVVRQALAYAFDFEWSNANLFYDQYTRTNSYWDNSELAAPEGPPTGEELALLEPHRALLPAEVFTGTYTVPNTGGTEDGLRANLEQATMMLEQAGWTVNDKGELVNEAGEPFTFEITLDSPTWDRITQPFIENLKRLGITATSRQVDPAQYETMVEKFEYDMIVLSRGMSPSPGNEQKNYWTCSSADTAGSQNYNGVCNDAIDALVDNVVQAASREDLITATHALDRALLWQHLVIPHWHIAADRVAYWNVIERPEVSPAYGIDFTSWYFNEADASVVQQAQKAVEFVDTQATVDAAGTAGITPPTPLPQATLAPVEPVTTTDGVTTTEGMTETTSTPGEGGGIPGGPIGVAVAVLIALGAVALLARRNPGNR